MGAALGSASPRAASPLGGAFFTDLSFSSRPTRRYTIEKDPDLLAAWSPALTGIIPAAASPTADQFPDPSSTPSF